MLYIPIFYQDLLYSTTHWWESVILSVCADSLNQLQHHTCGIVRISTTQLHFPLCFGKAHWRTEKSKEEKEKQKRQRTADHTGSIAWLVVVQSFWQGQGEERDLSNDNSKSQRTPLFWRMHDRKRIRIPRKIGRRTEKGCDASSWFAVLLSDWSGAMTC